MNRSGRRVRTHPDEGPRQKQGEGRGGAREKAPRLQVRGGVEGNEWLAHSLPPRCSWLGCSSQPPNPKPSV